MPKIIYFTDTHYGAKPVNRKDNYNKSILNKVRFILNAAYKNNCIVLHGGDLFDTPKINFLDFMELINLLQEFKDKGTIIHTVRGNEGHDGHIESSPLTLLESVGLIEIIEDFKDFDGVRVIGAGHGTDPVTASTMYSSGKVASILLTHFTLTREPVIFDHFLWEDFKIPVDIVCVAHYHPYQGIELVGKGASVARGAGGVGAGTGEEGAGREVPSVSDPLAPAPAAPHPLGIWFVAPGALSRRKKTKHDIDRVPKCVYIQVESGKAPRFKEIDIKCEKDIWTNNLKLEIEESIAANVQIKDEIDNMKKIMDETVMFTSNIEDAIKIYSKDKYSDGAVEYVIKKLRNI